MSAYRDKSQGFGFVYTSFKKMFPLPPVQPQLESLQENATTRMEKIQQRLKELLAETEEIISRERRKK